MTFTFINEKKRKSSVQRYFTNTYELTGGLLVACLMSQQQASVSQGWIYSDNFTCCHTQIEVADQTFYLTQSQYTDTGRTSPSADPLTPGAWQGSHWSANFLSHWYDSTLQKSRRKRDSNPGSSTLDTDALHLGQQCGIYRWADTLFANTESHLPYTCKYTNICICQCKRTNFWRYSFKTNYKNLDFWGNLIMEIH